jgi:hypothetical protein
MHVFGLLPCTFMERNHVVGAFSILSKRPCDPREKTCASSGVSLIIRTKCVFNFLILSFFLKDLMQVGECSFLQFNIHGNLEGNHVIWWDQFGKSKSLPHPCMEISSPLPILFICFFF